MGVRWQLEAGDTSGTKSPGPNIESREVRGEESHMKVRIRIRAVIIVVSFLAVACISWLSMYSGQTGAGQSGAPKPTIGKPVGELSVSGYGNTNAKPLPPGGPAPRTTDRHVDL